MMPVRELNFLVGFALKPAVLVLAVLALRAARRLPAGRGRRLVRLSLVAFILGELLCGVDVYLHRGMSPFFESGHDLLMAASFALFSLGLYQRLREHGACLNLDCERLGSCTQPAPECARSTAWGPLAGWTILAVAALGLVPLLAQPGVLRAALPAGIGARSFGAYLYDRTELLSIFQQKLLTLAAMAALVAGAASYFRNRRLTATGAALVFPGAGVLAFVYNRLLLVHPLAPEAVLTAFLEELFELLFLALVLVWLRGSPRRG